MAEAKKKKILIVDDDPTQVKLLSGILDGKGYEVIMTQDAPEGLKMAMYQKPDLIILDVMMPIINGFNFCSLLKSKEAHKDTPIILLTSRDQMDDVQIGMKMGADAYLTKPINTQELFKTIAVVEAMNRSEK